jgi:hypothetical protein
MCLRYKDRNNVPAETGLVRTHKSSFCLFHLFMFGRIILRLKLDVNAWTEFRWHRAPFVNTARESSISVKEANLCFSNITASWSMQILCREVSSCDLERNREQPALCG